MQLTRLTLKNRRNFKQADFDLQDRLGPRASLPTVPGSDRTLSPLRRPSANGVWFGVVRTSEPGTAARMCRLRQGAITASTTRLDDRIGRFLRFDLRWDDRTRRGLG